MQRIAVAAAGIGMLVTSAMAAPAVAGGKPEPRAALAARHIAEARTQSSAAAECIQSVGWVNAAAQQTEAYVTPGKPPSAVAYPPIPFVGMRSSASWYIVVNSTGTTAYETGLFLQGSNLYRVTNYLSTERLIFSKVGTGWGSFKTIATSNYTVAKPRHTYLYGLNSDGNVYRYAVNGNTFKALGKFGGFAKFKTMTVIAENPSYDTLLMTTNAGALYTIRIPVTATAKPVVKLIRSGGWQNFESLLVESCGFKGGLLITAIDRDTKTGYQYAMSKATGATTQLTGYGKIPAGDAFNGVFDGVADFAITTYYSQLVSE
ncbi:hypothetical protein [Kribbella sp. NPDC055071]